ncbi:DUF3846 domain-containing protein [Butyricicoccus sp. BIOML-A1]|nr:DUF3846 domain-containing protein [Butyricicoccus sp. BIOML-A1]
MKAIRKKPGCAPELIDIDNTLKALQAEVDGYIETVTIASDAVVICNEEGVLRGNALQLPVRRRGFCRHDPRGRP